MKVEANKMSNEQLISAHLSGEGGREAFMSSSKLVKEASDRAPFFVRLFARRYMALIANSLEQCAERMDERLLSETRQEMTRRGQEALRQATGQRPDFNVH